ncbi:MAG TPA: AAA family ATPase, partial [Fimbriimonadaceae bacterium]|nr:AAA family ATPase [Fimbriimonadaceae bacterium]
TYTARWLAQAVPGLTVLLMSGEQLWLIRECCQIARMLSPSLVIMEDVDLVASARDESRHPMYQVTLHQLLNEMDGIDAPEPILFLLTTNRPDAIEPAIASRPGRIDQAIEYPLPNAQCRRRLIELYGNGLELDLQDMDSIVARTEGASPAFVQEMLRKAALLSAEKSSDERPLRVTDEHCHEAIRELLFSGGELTRRLLGFESATA